MGSGRLLPNTSATRGIRFFLWLFSCGHRDRLGHLVIANSPRAAAGACSPQRLHEDSADSEIYLTFLSLATCILQSVSDYTRMSCQSNLSDAEDPRSLCLHRFLAESNQHWWRLYEFSGHVSGVSELVRSSHLVPQRLPPTLDRFCKFDLAWVCKWHCS